MPASFNPHELTFMNTNFGITEATIRGTQEIIVSLFLSLVSSFTSPLPCCHQANIVSQPRQAVWLAAKISHKVTFTTVNSPMVQGSALSHESSEIQLQRLCQNLNSSPQRSFPWIQKHGLDILSKWSHRILHLLLSKLLTLYILIPMSVSLIRLSISCSQSWSCLFIYISL